MQLRGRNPSLNNNGREPNSLYAPLGLLEIVGPLRKVEGFKGTKRFKGTKGVKKTKRVKMARGLISNVFPPAAPTTSFVCPSHRSSE